MKFVLASLFLFATPSQIGLWHVSDFRVDRIIDTEYGYICYVASHSDGSSHTTPSLQCFKEKLP